MRPTTLDDGRGVAFRASGGELDSLNCSACCCKRQVGDEFAEGDIALQPCAADVFCESRIAHDLNLSLSMGGARGLAGFASEVVTRWPAPAPASVRQHVGQ